jgi:uncharacterized protein (DUF433 family)
MDWKERIERRAPNSISYIKGTEVKVLRIVYLLASGWGFADILREHPEIEPEDIRACLMFAGQAADNEYARREMPPIIVDDDSIFSEEEASAEDRGLAVPFPMPRN